MKVVVRSKLIFFWLLPFNTTPRIYARSLVNLVIFEPLSKWWVRMPHKIYAWLYTIIYDNSIHAIDCESFVDETLGSFWCSQSHEVWAPHPSPSKNVLPHVSALRLLYTSLLRFMFGTLVNSLQQTFCCRVLLICSRGASAKSSFMPQALRSLQSSLIDYCAPALLHNDSGDRQRTARDARWLANDLL